MTSGPDHSTSDGNSADDEKDLINDKFHALVDGLSLDESSPSTYLDDLEQERDEEKFVPPIPPKSPPKKTLSDVVSSFKRWKNNPRIDRSDLDDDGAQV